VTKTDLKTIELPDFDEMRRRLETVVHDDHGRQKFVPRLLESAGRQIAGPGVVMMIQLAIHDYVKGMPPIMDAVMQGQVKDLVIALVDDDEAKQDALDMIEQVDKKIEEERNSRPPAPARLDLTDDDKTALVAQIKRLAAVYDEHVTDPHHSSRGHRADGVNPFYSQTLNGLYLEFYYGGPSKVWTPWGEWYFAAAQSYQTDLDGFMSRLTLREHIAQHNTAQGTIGPVYAILAIDGVELPEPVLPTDRRQYLSYEDSKAEWARFFGTE